MTTSVEAGRTGRLAIRVIRIYQREVSGRLPARCLLEPNCSEFALLAIERQGLLAGSRTALARYRGCRLGLTRTRGGTRDGSVRSS